MTPHEPADLAAPRPPAVGTLGILGIAIASALVPLNSTMIAVALPRIADDFGMATAETGVLVTLYLVVMLVGQPIAGRIADRVGPRRLASVALVGFGAASAAAMVADHFALLVALRGGQALFGAAIAPSVQAMLRLAVPSAQRGRAFGLQGSVIGVGAGFGPVLGGLLVAGFGWHAVFGANLPVVALVLVVLRRAVPAAAGQRAAAPPAHDAPAVRERVLGPVFVAAFAVQALTTVAQYTLLLVTPIVLDHRGWGSAQVGLALSALTLGTIVASPLGGRWGDRVGRRRPVLVGVAVATVGVVVSAAAGDGVAPAALVATLLVFGIGLGSATPSVLTAGVESAPESRSGTAAGLLSTGRYVGSITASVLLTLLVDDDADGVGPLLVLCVAAMAVSWVAATRLPATAATERTATRLRGR